MTVSVAFLLLPFAVALDLHRLVAADLKGLDRECPGSLVSRNRNAAHCRLGHAGIAARQSGLPSSPIGAAPLGTPGLGTPVRSAVLM